MQIRRSTDADLDRIDVVHRAAFGEPGSSAEPIEVGLVRALRADDGWVPQLSLVAIGAEGDVVGHVVCTEGHVQGGRAVGLGPIGVLPALQGAGVGAALMHAVLGAADALDYALVALLGHLDYYPRFGFVPAESLGLAAPDPTWGAHFQARTLHAWTPEVTGTFRYATPFDELG
jgi:putative acetyltransferase